MHLLLRRNLHGAQADRIDVHARPFQCSGTPSARRRHSVATWTTANAASPSAETTMRTARRSFDYSITPVARSMKLKVARNALSDASRVSSGEPPMKPWPTPDISINSAHTPACRTLAAICSDWR